MAGASTIGVVLIMLLSPIAAAGAAHPGVAKTYWVPNYYSSTNGCTKVSSSKFVFAAGTGVGGWSGSVSSATCKHAISGVGSSSSASASGGIEVLAPVHFSATSTGVNVTWTLNVAYDTKVVVPASGKCGAPTVNHYSYYYTYYASYENTTTYSSDCSEDASVSIYGNVYLYDSTTGYTYYPSNYWYGVSKYFDRSNSSSYTVVNWSNPTMWSNNYSSSYASGYQSGNSGAGSITPASSPTWYINGTFTSTDKFYVIATLTNSVSSSVYQLKGGSVTSSITGTGTGNYEDFSAVVH